MAQTRKKPAKAAPAPDGLIGMFGHTRKSGVIEQQFRIIARSDDDYIVQLYSWFHGYPTKCATLPRTTILRCDLYQTHEAWREAGDQSLQAAE